MWVILLDRSSSMGEAFGGDTAFAGRTRRSDATSKLDAAKQAVREHLAGLGAVSRVVLIAFDSTAEVVYDGPSSDSRAIAGALDGIATGGGTDIAVALRRAARAVQDAPGERSYRALTVTDGKSDLVAAQDAADALARAGAVIDVLLIDPTATGEAVARAIAVNGIVSAVASATQLQEGIATARAAQEEQRAGAAAFVARHEEERVQLARDKPVEERLAFTATYAADIAPEGWYPFTVYLHLAALQADVHRQILDQVQAGAQIPFISVAHAGRGVVRGTALTLTPRVDGLEFNPPAATLQWYEDIQDFRFRFRAVPGRAGTSAFGRLDVAVGSLPIAHLGVAVNVHVDASQVPKTGLAPVHADIYQDVFASYSSKDATIVQACRAVYWGLGVHLAVDKQTLRAGQAWDPALREIIEKCDLFQLFWSTNASGSEAVRQEYLHAIGQIPKKQPGFIRPVTWEEPHPRIPEELEHYHFTPLDLAAIARLSSMDLSAAVSTPAASAPAARGAPVPVAVLPLLPGAAPQTVQAVRDDISEAVHFLEALTGLRYYPVPTLLVDEHVVRRVRTGQTVDRAPSDPQLVSRAIALQQLLLALSLRFHVRGLLPQGESRERFDERFGAGRIMPPEQFEWLRRICESFPRIADVISPGWRGAMRELGPLAGQAELQLGLSDFIRLLLDLVIEQVTKHEAPDLHADQYADHGNRIELPEALAQVFEKNGGRQDTTRRMYRLVGPPRAFAALLAALRERIAPLLPAIDALDRMRAEPRPPGTDELIRLCAVAGFVAREVLPKEHPLLERTGNLPLSRWIEELVSPRWVDVARGLAQLGFADPASVGSLPEVLQVFLDAVQRALDEGLRAGDFPHACSYPVAQEAWDIVRADIGDYGIALGKCEDYRGKRQGELEGPLSALVRLFRGASARLVELLSNAPRARSTQQRVFVELSPTFGIFAPARSEATDHALHRWAAEQGVAQSVTLPGAERVLFCLGARDRFEEKLRGAFDRPEEARRLAARFQRCVLVHEHFHAVLETGLTANGEAARGPASDRWRDASRLNEALAVWAELHFVRGDATMERLVWDYIRDGTYPDWPYAGAGRIEALFASGGMDAVRGLITSIRQAPEEAQREFDRATSAN